jgi:acid phosphatase
MGPEGPIMGSWGLSDAVLPNALTFLSIGDWGRGGKGGQEVTAPPLAAWAAATRASFVVSLGDNVYVDGIPLGASEDEVDATMAAFFSAVYSQPALESLPFYTIFGNHDYRGDVEAQVQWRGDPRWRPGRNFTKRWRLPGGGSGTAHPRACLSAVFTDTSPLLTYYSEGEYADEHPVLQANCRAVQKPPLIAWTHHAISRAAAACDAVMVFGHHPLFSPGEHANNAELIGHYASSLEAGGVDAYIAGHDHILGHSREVGGGVEHIVTGAGSEIRFPIKPGKETQWVSTVRGFTVHSVNATHMAHSYIWCDDEGKGFTQKDLPGRVAFHVLKKLRVKG